MRIKGLPKKLTKPPGLGPTKFKKIITKKRKHPQRGRKNRFEKIWQGAFMYRRVEKEER